MGTLLGRNVGATRHESMEEGTKLVHLATRQDQDQELAHQTRFMGDTADLREMLTGASRVAILAARDPAKLDHHRTGASTTTSNTKVVRHAY